MNSKRGLVQPYADKLGHLARVVDGFWVAMSLYLACRLYPESWASHYSLAALVGIVAFFFAGELQDLYRPWRVEAVKKEFLAVWTTWAMAVPLLLLIAFLTKTSEVYSRWVTLMWFILAPTLASLSRACVKLALQELRRRGRNMRSVAIVGANALGANLAREIRGSTWMGMRLVGIFDDRHPTRLGPIDAVRDALQGATDALVARARAGEIDLVYIALPMRAEVRISDLIRRLSDTTVSVHLAYDFGGFDLMQARWANLGPFPVVSIVEDPFRGAEGWIKRLEDLVIGAVILTTITIPMLCIALAIKLTSKGPVLFRQRRYGLNGEQIQVLKFRTMTVCEDGDDVVQATRNDLRVTPFGAFLRRTSLDELPQFLQVLSGEMSIVGPRPHAVAHNERYRTLIPGYMLRHKVKPGITGWAQINGWRGETDTLEKMEKRVEFDLAYIRNWALLLDLKIILLTIFRGAADKNAY